MKVLKLSLVIMAAALITFGLSGIADAMHSGGVAYCDACHTMHNSQDGLVVTLTPGGYLMMGSDPSSTCLICHGDPVKDYGQLTADGSGYRSGGDFYWLTKTFGWESHGHDYESTGDSHGHNIIAVDEGLTLPDQTLSTAPGGTFMSAYLGCNSCHDPHGSQGNTLLLYGVEQTQANYPGAGGYSFGTKAPVLVNAGRKTPVSDAKHSAYGSGMSEWCANCHEDFLGAANKHVAGDTEHLGATIAVNYNAYVSTDDLSGGAYWEIVPFETGDTDPALLDKESTAGPTANSNVMCLTCHRSHATAFPDIGRWDFGATLMSDSHPKGTDTGVTGDDVVNSYYGRTFTAIQRSLCNKCHIQD